MTTNKNIQKALIPNTVDTKPYPDFLKVQDTMKNPAVFIVDEDTNECIERFLIEAEDMEDLMLMYEKKIFYTSSIPKGEVQHKYGAIFYGVEKKMEIDLKQLISKIIIENEHKKEAEQR
ncbi:hypothetical protein [Metabacillus fastidiosus]|uniref:hypothetical protein n=1 Tax=Metabacillus fastidiosus TaxID=1458 RepID=UPI002E1BA898|nr:hypothetical protein [Metabacillus fastidiosus]